MRVSAYMALHYGADYLGYAIKAVIDQVDTFYVLYSPKPSYGHDSGRDCPDTEELLFQTAHAAAGDKLKWVLIRHTIREGDHRNQIFQQIYSSEKPDILAVIDSDEIWGAEAFAAGIKYAYDSKAFNIGAKHDGWKHFWRSFNEYCTDGFCPIRFHNLGVGRGTQDLECPAEIYHFGYAQRNPVMDYKWSIHGHQDELRTEWRHNIYNLYKKGVTRDLHPVAYGLWPETKDFDRNKMPQVMHSHPFFNMERID